jgi:uncharacterized protein (TIGR02246 family)
MSRGSILVRAALVLAVGLSAATARGEDVRKAIDAGNAAFRAAFLAGDAQRVSELYTTDAEVIAPGSPIARGRTAIAAFWKGAMGGVKDVSLETRAVETQGDLAVEDGTAKLTGADGAVSADRYVVVWKREGGKWKLHRDIWNSGK